MSNFQSKMEEGLSKFQGGVEQSKAKISTLQELARLKKSLKESSEEKAMLLLELGELAHLRIREEKIKDPDMLEVTEKICQKDQKMYQLQKTISQLTEKQEEDKTCQCGAQITETDKFCGECGTRVNQVEKAEEVAVTTCATCEMEVSAAGKYCNCCGAIL